MLILPLIKRLQRRWHAFQRWAERHATWQDRADQRRQSRWTRR